MTPTVHASDSGAYLDPSEIEDAVRRMDVESLRAICADAAWFLLDEHDRQRLAEAILAAKDARAAAERRRA